MYNTISFLDYDISHGKILRDKSNFSIAISNHFINIMSITLKKKSILKLL